MSVSTSPLLSPPSITSRDDDHSRTMRRIFIGPMPERAMTAGTSTQATDVDVDGEDEGLSSFIREHAFRFFIQHGGKAEDWGDTTERSVREDMLRRWRGSEWGRIRRQRRKRHQSIRWIGGTFEVGEIMGVNILQEQEEEHSRRTISQVSPSLSMSQAPLTTSADTFVTAKSNITSSYMRQEVRDQNDLLYVSNSNADTSPRISASSSTPLLQESQDALSLVVPHVSERPSPYRGVKSDGDMSRVAPMQSILVSGNKAKLKTKTVHYKEVSPSPTGEQEPAPPGEVLARTGSAVGESSAGATAEVASAADSPDVNTNDVYMRDRMLVRVSHSAHESIGPSFDEIESRTMRGLQHEDWAEFMVVWRRHHIEIYEDYKTPGKEWALGHKHLAFLVPLREMRTKLSLFSPVDLTFCLVCRPTPVATDRVSKRRFLFYRATRGLNLFVFKTKSRSRAIDWMWHLWNELGGEIPGSLDIYCPALDTRVKVDVPSSLDDGYTGFSRESVIDMCRTALRELTDWDYLVQQALLKGKSLELCWRTETKLDWIWLEDDVDGNSRQWEVLFGIALKYPGRPSHLEIRLAEHYATHLTLNDGTRLHEPPSIEGYLHRIKPNSQSKSAVYLASHDGYLFSIRPSRAHPPTTPGALPTTLSQAEPCSLREAEIRRGREQILDSDWFCDLRSVIAVRRAFQTTVRGEGENVPVGALQQRNDGGALRGVRRDGEADISWPEIERMGSDEEDEGGDEGLAKAQDKSRLRMRRSFELLLRSGHVVRFEAHSRKAAIEWITHLRVLISYWALRHRTDSRAEMELLQASTGRQRLTVTKHADGHDQPPEGLPDPDAAAPFLGSFWNWCVMDECRPIIKSGRMFVRRGLRGQYQHMQLVLLSGYLAQFHLVRHTHMHHRRSLPINILDAYVCSGYFAALALPRGEYTPNAPPVARIFQDGLETADADEDTLFMLWFRHPTSSKALPYGERNGKFLNDAAIPRLSAKRKVLVCRARSKLERDAWCWALNCEIERLVRASRAREQKARKEGALADL